MIKTAVKWSALALTVGYLSAAFIIWGINVFPHPLKGCCPEHKQLHYWTR